MEVEDFIERAMRERRSLQDALGDMLSKYDSIPSGKERSVLAFVLKVEIALRQNRSGSGHQ